MLSHIEYVAGQLTSLLRLVSITMTYEEIQDCLFHVEICLWRKDIISVQNDLVESKGISPDCVSVRPCLYQVICVKSTDYSMSPVVS